jgi:diguanylate cyclase (GGDEF)-like protein/PAS domain S-box-containing protein
MRLLILEDNEDDAALIIDTLRRARLDPIWQRVETREDFASVVSDAFDLILADYNLAQFTGLDALQLVRARGLDVPFILVSGSIGEDIAVAAMHSGADDYLLKDRTARLGPAVLRALEKRRLRRQKEETESALRESERRFSSMLANVQLLSVMLDRTARITYCNDFLLRLTGWTREEVLGADWFERFVPGDALDRRGEFLARVAQAPDAWHEESAILTRTSERRSIRWNNSVLRSDAGEIIGTASIGQDVTEQLQAEAKIQGLNRIHAMLSSINTLIVRAVSPQELFEGACRIAVEHGKFGAAWIGELDRQRLEVHPVAGAGVEPDSALMRVPLLLGPDAPPDSGVVQSAVRAQQATYDNDIARNPALGGERRREAIRRGFRSVSTLPLLIDGEVAATFAVFAGEPNVFDQEEMSLLNELAANLSLALEHMARKRRIEGLSRVRALSGEINAAIVRIRDRETLLKETCRIAAQQGKFEMVWIGEVDFDRESVRVVASSGFSEATAQAVSWTTINAAQGTLSEAIRTRSAAVRNNIEAALPRGGLRDEAMRAGCLSTVCLPVIVDNSVRALIALFAGGRNFFDAEELSLLNEVAADVSFALQSIASRERVEYLSYYDPLTGLPNRTLYIDRAGQLRARGAERPSVAFLLLNIERFRNINDTFGRHGGDELLRLVAKRLEAAFGSNECLARVGADTFGILVRGIRDPTMVVHAVENRVLGCFVQPFIVGGNELRVAAKVGIALHPAYGGRAVSVFNNGVAGHTNAPTSGVG